MNGTLIALTAMSAILLATVGVWFWQWMRSTNRHLNWGCIWFAIYAVAFWLAILIATWFITRGAK